MRCTLRALYSIWQDRRGATAVEYGLLLAMVAIAIIASLTGVGDITAAIWNDVATNVIQHLS